MTNWNKHIDNVIDIVWDNSDYDVDVSGPGDYDIMPYVWDKKQLRKILKEELIEVKYGKYIGAISRKISRLNLQGWKKLLWRKRCVQHR